MTLTAFAVRREDCEVSAVRSSIGYLSDFNFKVSPYVLRVGGGGEFADGCGSSCCLPHTGAQYTSLMPSKRAGRYSLTCSMSLTQAYCKPIMEASSMKNKRGKRRRCWSRVADKSSARASNYLGNGTRR
jgi:hypothetical protein